VAAKLVFDGGRLAVLARPGARADAPDRLELYSVSTGRLLHDWPLLARPRTLSLSGGIAAFAVAGGRGLYAIRLADGRQTLVSPVRRKDVPQIGSRGLVYESSLMRTMRQPGKFVLKFVPATALGVDLRATVDRLRTRWPITSFTMDGQRVGVVLDAPGRGCDQVHYWNIPWHYFARINMADDFTCSRHMSIRSLSLGGLTSEWVAVRNHVARVVMSNSIACIERVIATGSAAGRILLAGDTGLLGLGRLPGSTLLTRSGFDPVTKAVVASPLRPALALSVDGGRLASLGADGRVTLQRPGGAAMSALSPGTGSRAIALRRNRLVVLTGSRLELWNTARGRLLHDWRVPAGTRSAVDLQFGIAVFTSGRTVYAMNVNTGRTAVLARAPRAVQAAIEAPGVAYTYNARGHGYLRFVPMSTVERSLGLR